MKLEKNISLKPFNTFHTDVIAKMFCTVKNDKDFNDKELLKLLKENTHLILGGGSNTLFTKDFDGLIVLIKNEGKQILNENDSHLTVKVSAGVDWESFVKWSVDNNLVGLHNLAYIPGTVGATPIQNVGAYGVEIKDFLTEVEFLNIQTEKIEMLRNRECKFGYRDSVFKNELKDNIVIKSVTFKLPKFKENIDEKYLQYSGIKESLDGKEITPKTLYECIKDIRKIKLPDIKEYGSCGSTFKNPEISILEYEKLLEKYPELPKFETSKKDTVKIPAAYILEKLGWKNKRVGDVGTWISHPLIVTNYGNATGNDILSFIKQIQLDFKSNTNLNLECEINIIY